MIAAWMWIVFFLFVLCAIAFIILALTVLRPVQKTQQSNANSTLQAAYDAGSGHIDVTTTIKPFSILTKSRPNDLRNAAVFTDLGSLGILFDISSGYQNALMANTFVTSDTLIVIALQIFTPLPNPNNPVQTRTVGIYDLATATLLTQADVDFRVDTLEYTGFYTHPLAVPVVLQPFKQYVIVSTYLAHDQYVAINDVVQPILELTLQSSAIVRNATVLKLPDQSAFTLTSNTLLFASFQVQKADSINQIAWGIDVAYDGLPTFPPKYMYDLNVEAINEKQVRIQTGVCINHQNDTNIVNNMPIVLSTSDIGLNGLDDDSTPLRSNAWYAVYIIASTLQRLPNAGLLSLNFQEPLIVPVGYNCFRRVGWVYVGTSGLLLKTHQTGNGAQRTTFYDEPQPIFQHNFTALPSGQIPSDVEANRPYVLPLKLTSIAATSCVLRITSSNDLNAYSLFMTIGPQLAEFPQSSQFLSVPLKNFVQEAEVFIPTFSVPHQTQIALQTVHSIGSDVPVTVELLNFTGDI